MSKESEDLDKSNNPFTMLLFLFPKIEQRVSMSPMPADGEGNSGWQDRVSRKGKKAAVRQGIRTHT